MSTIARSVRIPATFCLLLGACPPSRTGNVAPAAEVNRHYLVHRPPLDPDRFVRLPFGCVRPAGWLKRQLQIEADGLIRHLLDPETFDSFLNPCKQTESEVSYQHAVYQEGLVVLAGMTGDDVFVRRAAPSPSTKRSRAQRLAWTSAKRESERWSRKKGYKFRQFPEEGSSAAGLK